MKKNSRINRLMLKWSYKPIMKPPLQISRELKLSKLLEQKVKIKWNIFSGCKNDSNEYKERMEVFTWFRRLGKLDDEIESIWRTFRNKPKSDYNKMPKKPRKDNGHPELDGINFNGGGGNRNTIRVPSKKRKNKWKNFKKLFPEYCKRNGL
jgi:hypothetical protein